LRFFEKDRFPAGTAPAPERGFDWSQAEPLGPDHALFPAGCRTYEATRDQLLQGLSPDDMLKLDQQMQTMILEQFSGLKHVCMTSANLLRNLERAMQVEGEDFVGKRLAGVDVAELFRELHPEEDDAGLKIAEAFAAADATLASTPGPSTVEICVVASPRGAPGDRFRDLARRKLPLAEPAMVANQEAEDLVFYRERSALPLGVLEQVGPVAYEAYSQIASVAHFTPHSRTDINQWRAARSPVAELGEGAENANQPTVLNGPAMCAPAR
jgi:hypothetical protein